MKFISLFAFLLCNYCDAVAAGDVVEARYVGNHEPNTTKYVLPSWKLNPDKSLFSVTTLSTPKIDFAKLKKKDDVIEVRFLEQDNASFIALTNNSEKSIHLADGFFPLKIARKVVIDTAEYVPSIVAIVDYGLEIGESLPPKFTTIIGLSNFYRELHKKPGKVLRDPHLITKCGYLFVFNDGTYTIVK